MPKPQMLLSLRYTSVVSLFGLLFALNSCKHCLHFITGADTFFDRRGKAETLVLHLVDAAAQVVVSLYFGVFEELDLITRTVRVKNVGESTVRLCKCASLCLDFLHTDMDLITFNGHHLMERCLDRASLRSGVQSVGSTRGASSHQHNPFVILCGHQADEDSGLCYGAMLLYSGNFEAAVECSQYENTRMVMGIHPHHFCWTLPPNGEFTAPEAALVCSPTGFGDVSRQFHRAVREHLVRDPYQGKRHPVLINNWEATYFDFTADKLVSIAREAAPLGIELFVMDDGWFGKRDDDNSGLGDWFVNEKKLPGGLGALVPRVNELGLKFGIWVEPEMVSEDSGLYRAHPDWALRVPGRAPARGRGQLVLDFSRQDVRDHIYSQLKTVLDSAPIAYVKWDMNRSLTDVCRRPARLPPGRGVPPLCAGGVRIPGASAHRLPGAAHRGVLRGRRAVRRRYAVLHAPDLVQRRFRRHRPPAHPVRHVLLLPSGNHGRPCVRRPQ